MSFKTSNVLKVYAIAVITTAIAFTSHAQTWESTSTAKQKAAKQISQKQSAIKSWRDHLQKWGLDSNYNHALAVGGKLNTDGWSGFAYYQKRDNNTSCHFFQLSFSEIKHEKQVKQQKGNTAFPELGAASPYVFGKINNLYTLQLGYGKEYLLLPGLLEGNMSVSLRVQAGASMAMLKPYYLKLIYVNYDSAGQHATMQEEKYSEQNKEKFLNTSFILGASNWTKSLSEITYVPGAFADLGIAIEPLKNKNFIKTITIGGNFAFYSKELAIMAENKAYPWQANFYVGLSMGKRWK
ncbi:hypothetical protein [Taibaiella soli]|uniref:Transporter n=1 Tax=Taibaiella soli TaxID=1649169 RepID=A0A2W2AE54_9BACT|nr:hypothetical protein [Taibaiella soli]PZF73745.1 hypothetical protein DN068_07040 [Taibaiella soli]